MTESAALLEYMPSDGEQLRELDVERARDLLRGCRDINLVLEIRDVAVAAREFARVRRVGLEAYNAAQDLVLRSERRLGEFLEKAELHAGGRPKKNRSTEVTGSLTLEDLELTKNESSRAQKLAAIPETVFEQHVAAVKAAGEKLTTKGTIAAASAAADYDSDEYYTPEPYIEAAREVMGGIDLDPASCALAQNVVKAKRFYTATDDGLGHVWRGNVWLNSPYSQPLEGKFTEALLKHYGAGRVPNAIRLMNATVDTTSFHRLASIGMVCFPKGRINFYTAKGSTIANRASQVFIYLGRRERAFEKVFGRFGLVGKLRGKLAIEGE